MVASRGQVTFAYLSGSTVEASYFDCAIRMMKADRGRLIGAIVGAPYTTMVAAGRNAVVEAFLAAEGSGREWLLMVDTDMTFPPDLVEKMLACASKAESKIVSGLAVARRGFRLGVNAYSIRFATTDMPVAMQEIHSIPEGPAEVDAVGGACLLIHRSVLEKVKEKYGTWFSFVEFTSIIAGKKVVFESGEDITFCLRARSVGEAVVVDPSIWLGHVKEQVLGRGDLEAYQDICKSVGEENYLELLRAKRSGL